MELRDYKTEEDGIAFNFWPAFADLMLSLVLILILILFLFFAFIVAGNINIAHIKKNQMELIDELGIKYGVIPENVDNNEFRISTNILIRNEPQLQMLGFSDNILFRPDQYILSDKGRSTLNVVGEIIKKKIFLIREIQIQGHADTDISSRYPSNIDLASMRAIEVFKFLKNQVGINPSEHLMSATSFGEYKPVNRSDSDLTYNQQKLNLDNSTKILKDKNRRIELLLFYSVLHK